MPFCDLSNQEATVEFEVVEGEVLQPAGAIYLWPREVACCRD